MTQFDSAKREVTGITVMAGTIGAFAALGASSPIGAIASGIFGFFATIFGIKEYRSFQKSMAPNAPSPS